MAMAHKKHPINCPARCAMLAFGLSFAACVFQKVQPIPEQRVTPKDLKMEPDAT